MLSKGLLPLAARETFSQPNLERRTEANAGVELTDDDLLVIQEATVRALQGLYHYNALAVSRLVPEHGLILDLGCGGGLFPAYLAQRRPDITVIGVEESPRLVARGQNLIAEQGLQDRMNINEGKITEFSKRIPARIDMITGVLSLHTVASTDDLFRCFQEMSLVRIRCGCAIWMFDFCRPNLLKTAEEFPGTLMPGTPLPFKRSTRNKLMASFTYREMSESIAKVSLGTVHHAQSRNMKIYQAHWLNREDELASKDELWQEGRLAATAVEQFKELCRMFPSIPLPKHLK